ncbi:Aste57867_20012 [Aphanomyces stellatus]|uniref:Aste57867_20012 protein n=1 Tax=Aphanomyces stellatus TaxID=120398 RepID=A0A485LFI3_9STRA|nr:hypothetical protein As57867_019946 [Aphanomyces stellatus]VFT96709.1 Aste57867_20012 [Aphanomyces stellatus]
MCVKRWLRFGETHKILKREVLFGRVRIRNIALPDHMSKITARLEKQARDPIEVLRSRLKDVSETSVLNTQQLLEIKTDYLHRAESTKGQLDGFVQAQIDEIERASTLLSYDDSIAKVSHSLKNMGTSCHRMRAELGDEGVASEVSIARRNLKELQSQMQFYDEMPRKLAEMEHVLQANLGELVSVFTKFLVMDDWRQKMLLQLHIASKDNQDEMLNSKHASKALAAILPRLTEIEHVGKRILDGTWTIIINCIEMVQFDRKRLTDAFQIVEHLEKRKRKRLDTNKVHLDNTLSPVKEAQLPSMFQVCRDQLQTSLKTRVADMFVLAPDQKDSAQAFNGILNNASNLLLDLEYVEHEVAALFPPSIDAIQVFISSYNSALEEQFAKICGKSDLGVAQKLQLIQWIDYYNSQIGKYRSGTVSDVLEQTANLQMKLYLDGIQDQIQSWVTNIYNRDEETITGPSGELHSTRPNDIMNILSSQISIAQEWLSGHLLSRVVLVCLTSLMKQLEHRQRLFVSSIQTTDIEALCSFVNDTDVLQSKTVELIDNIQFPGAPDQDDQLAKLKAGIGEKLEVTSTDIVKLAVQACALVVQKVFDEVEADTTAHWFGKKWEEQDPVVENLLATLEDFCKDFKSWISGSFFYAKIIRQALDKCQEEYTKRFFQRTSQFANVELAFRLIDNDVQHVHACFMKYEAELRRSGIRSDDDLTKHLEPMQMLSLVLSRKITVEDLQSQLADLEQQGMLDDASVKTIERFKSLVAAAKRFVPSSDKGKKASSSSSDAKPAKKTFFKKAKDKTKDEEKVEASKVAVEAASPEFQVKTASMDDFLK